MDSEKTFQQLISGLRSYCELHDFKKAIFGLSGGIDSALTAVLAVNALGKENCLALYLPTKFSSKESKEDAFQLAENLGLKIKEIPIQEIFDQYLDKVEGHFSGEESNKTEENIQARIRANILFAFSNKFNYLVLATGNKSEILTGYFTLYGDAAGGLAPFANLYKTEVYELAKHLNKKQENHLIPKRILKKAPTAELHADQTDQETLPPYDELDAILKLYVDEEREAEEIIAKGFEKETVEKVIAMLKASEFKRKQLPEGIEI